MFVTEMFHTLIIYKKNFKKNWSSRIQKAAGFFLNMSLIYQSHQQALIFKKTV